MKKLKLRTLKTPILWQSQSENLLLKWLEVSHEAKMIFIDGCDNCILHLVIIFFSSFICNCIEISEISLI